MGKRKTIVSLETGKQFNSVENAATFTEIGESYDVKEFLENGLHFFLIAESWQDETK